VAARTRETGVRMALGARVGHLRWLVLRRVLIYLALGLAGGVGLALVSPFDTGNQLGWGAAAVRTPLLRAGRDAKRPPAIRSRRARGRGWVGGFWEGVQFCHTR